MSFVPLKFPPGVYRGGTAAESSGRYYDTDLVRWIDSWLLPIKGWRLRSPTAPAMAGVGRAIITWRDNVGNRWIAIGTNSNLYILDRNGPLFDITPTGFTAGLADANAKMGYGQGGYGNAAFGTPRPDLGTIIPAAVWTLDTWGEHLVGCCNGDGKLYEWSLATGTPAAVIANAPTACQGLVVTDERFIFALGAGGNPREIAWCDQENDTSWTPSATNQAGSFELKTAGTLMAGLQLKGRTLLFSSDDVWAATYQGYPLVYGFAREGVGCGLIAPNAKVAIDDAQAVWMSRDGFWLDNGYAQRIPCEVQDFVFSNLNTGQASKVSCIHISAFGEVWWFYPSSASKENDRYVFWCYRTNTWGIGALSRLAGTDKGAFNLPMMVGPDGFVYEHEVGFNYGGALPYATTGPIELGSGDRMMEVQGLVPDDKTQGDVTVTFAARDFPNDDPETFGPYSLTTPTDFLFQGREVEVTFTGARLSDWRVGVPKLDVTKGDPR